jgi:hypothetical protein
LTLILTVALITFGIGVLLGFIGAGGAGTMLALLTLAFHLPIHEAVGTSLAAMVFVTVSGAISHYRETNVDLRAGLIVGITGMVGAVLGADLSQDVPEDVLQLLAGLALWFLALLMWIRTRVRRPVDAPAPPESTGRSLGAGALGLTGGLGSAFFGVGMAPFLQLGMLVVLGLPLRKTVGTTMLALIFISLSGSAALAGHGQVSVPHLIGATLGMTAGSYAGAKLTRRAPLRVLRAAIVLTPFISGAFLIAAQVQ